MTRRDLLLSIFLLFLVVILNAQNKREVYITLDVSGSMDNDKYILANYTAQLISILCEQDEVNLIIYSHTEKISGGANMYERIQIPYDNLPNEWDLDDKESQIKDIEEFNRVFKEDPEADQWLFIIGDGIWNTIRHPLITARFKGIATEENLHICYLQTGQSDQEHNDFTSFIEDLKVADIHKSSIEPASIMNSCNKIASKILGLSTTSLNVTQAGTNCISATSELPCRKFIVIYQDEREPSFLPKLQSVMQSGASLAFEQKGTPSTAPLISGAATPLVSGNIWIVDPGSLMPAGVPVTFCFNKVADSKKIRIFPVVEIDVSEGNIRIGKGEMKKIDENTIGVCEENETALVTITLADENGSPLPEVILRNTKVEVISNNISHKAELVNGRFECELPLTDETTLYYSRSECPGYFMRTSDIKKIVKTDDCPEEQPPPPPPETSLPEQYLGSIRFSDILRGDCMESFIFDSATLEVLDPSKFDISVHHDYPLLFKRVDIRLENEKIVLCFEPRGEWCDCFFPDSLHLRIKISPKVGADFGGKTYGVRNIPSTIDVLKDSWFNRCKSILLAMLIALLAYIFLYFLKKKPRFKRGSVVTSEYSDYYNTDIRYDFLLRQKGVANWLNRWFIPFGSEKNSILFFKVDKNFTFIATNSRYYIKFQREFYDPTSMNSVDYDKDDTNPFIHFTAGNKLTIERDSSNGGKLRVEYDPREGIHDDIPAFRFFLVILMATAAIFFSSCLFLIIKSLLMI